MEQQTEDYKRLYLEQRIQTLEIESHALQLKHEIIQTELPRTRKELAEYMEKIKKEKEESEENEKGRNT